MYAQEIIVPRNDGTDKGDVLLGEQVVTYIEVDGANRKWLGTEGGGVYLVSEDGLEEIQQFNAGNSPLAFRQHHRHLCGRVSGEVFFAPRKVSFLIRGMRFREVQPTTMWWSTRIRSGKPIMVRWPSKVCGKHNVKIQDMGGNLVFETESLGGQALWDGTNFRGERVATGVYLIFLSSADGSFTHVTKLLFIH